jgi:hypothetical protein
LRGFESGLDDIIASRIGAGPQIVTIGPNDAGFESVGCGDWSPALRQRLTEMDTMGDGTWMTHTDFIPGKFTATQPTMCIWERLSGFGGTRRERIERGLSTSGRPPTVVIEPTDAGFFSDGCGVWAAVVD